MAGGSTPKTNLRVPGSSFHGRHAELSALAAHFEEARLVSVVGPGGMGKTRLALRYAATRVAALARRGRGGVWMVDLGEARSAHGATSEVAATLGVALAGGALARSALERARVDAVGRAIASLGPTLLVLDNVEQLADAAPRLVSTWLEMAPSARFLVATRVVLGLPGERVLALGPLAPDDARALFVDRTQSVRGRVSGDDLAVVGEIVDAIDRMPLAIELAASRMRVLSAEELRRRVERPLDVLSGGTAVVRHASVRGAVLDSLALLAPEARRAFALLAILRSGFDLAAAEAALAPVVSSRAEVLDALDALARASLLRVELEGELPARYSFFATIREVAEERCAAEPGRESVRDAHAAHYAALARRARAEEDESALERSVENVLAAADTARALGRAHDVLEIALALEPILSRRGLSSLRERLFDDGLALPAARSTLVVEAYLGRGLARRELGDSAGAHADVEAALAAAIELGDAGLHAAALVRLGGLRDLRGDTAGARHLLGEALVLLGRTSDGPRRAAREAEALLRLGHAHRREGELDAAHAAILRASERYRALARDEGLASALYELGVVAMFREHVEEAFAHFDEGLSVARRGGVRVMEGACLTARGCLLQDLGRLDEALVHHAEAASIFRDHGAALREASALHYLATTYLERGEPSEALSLIAQSRRILASIGTPRYEVLTQSVAALAHAALSASASASPERVAACDAALERASIALASVPNEPALTVTLALHRATVALRTGRGGAPLTLDEARRRVRASATDDSRFALRELERALGGTPSAPAHEALWVWGAGEAFRAPGGERVTLPARSPLRRLLELFVERRERAPGEPVSLDQLVAAGWPGEKIGADAALNRAYVAVATLRKRGLREVIVRAGGGYAISRAVTVRRVAD